MSDAPDRIYLIYESDEMVWCADPNPSGCPEPPDIHAEYIRADLVMGFEAQGFMNGHNSAQSECADDAADAKRLRWLLAGNGYFLEEEGVCGHGPGDEDEARYRIDNEIAQDEAK